MNIKTQLTFATIIAALMVSGCSQQMVGQQAAQASVAVTQEPVVKTIVDCSKCAKPTPKPRPTVKKCWHGRNAKGQCNPAPRMRMAPPPKAAPKIVPRPVVQQPLPKAKQCWHGRNAKGQCKPRPRMNVAPSKRCWHGRNAKGQCNPGPRMNTVPRQVRPVVPAPKYQQMATPKFTPKGNYRGAIKIDGVMQQYQN